MKLKVWNDLDDPYNHNDLVFNWERVDKHDHSPSWGKPIPEAGLDTNSVSNRTVQNNAIGTQELQDGAVTNSKLAADAVTTDKVADGTLLGSDVANKQIGVNHITDAALSAIVPLGTVTAWFRPTVDVPVPQGWVICAGQTVSDHDWGGTPVGIPDLQNRFILGAATTGTGTGPTTPPAESLHNIPTVGGANNRNLNHTHTIAAHTHIANTHTHGTFPHSHGGATAGSGVMTSGSAGAHNHQLRTRGVWVLNGPQASIDEMMLQAAYIGDQSGGSGDIGIDGSNVVHSHSVPNHTHAIAAEAPSTGVATDRGMSSVSQTTDDPAQDIGADLRPRFVGLLYIMKVKNPV